MAITLSDQQWVPIDEAILRGETIGCLKAIKDVAGVRLREALSMFYDRYEMLRSNRPDEFTLKPGECFSGLYS